MNTYKVSSLFTAVGLTVTLVGGCASERADENTVVVGALSNPAAAPVPSPDVTRLALMNSIYESVNTKIISGANVYNVGREHKAVVSGSTLLFGKYVALDVSALTRDELIELDSAINSVSAPNVPGPIDRTCLTKRTPATDLDNAGRNTYAEDTRFCTFVVRNPYRYGVQAISVNVALPPGTPIFTYTALLSAVQQASEQLAASGDSSLAGNSGSSFTYIEAAKKLASWTSASRREVFREVATHIAQNVTTSLGATVSIVIPTTGAKNVWVSIGPAIASPGVGISASLINLRSAVSKKQVADFLTGAAWSACVSTRLPRRLWHSLRYRSGAWAVGFLTRSPIPASVLG